MSDNKQKQGFWGIIRPQSVKGLVFRIILCLLIPEAFLMLCGLIFDAWLHLYSLTTLIFICYVIVLLLCLAVLICSAVNFAKRGKKASAPAETKEQVKRPKKTKGKFEAGVKETAKAEEPEAKNNCEAVENKIPEDADSSTNK